MKTSDSKLFGELFKKFRLKAEFETLPELGEVLAEKGHIFEDSTLSRWQTGSRVPLKRNTLLALVKILIEKGGILRLNEANQLMEAAGQGYLTEKEIANLPTHLLLEAPFQAPRVTPLFLGRERELVQIKQIVKEIENPLIAIYGPGGIGKSALAIRAAQLLQSQFPDGVIWSRVDTSSPMSILTKIAKSYGEDISHIKDLHVRCEIVRSILAHRKAILVFDNAQSSEKLRLLLPGKTDSLVIITSRDLNLEILTNAIPIHLHPFSFQETFSFFQKAIGVRWAEKHKNEIEKIGELTGNLPLAINIVARKLAPSKKESLEEIILELQKEDSRLETLRTEDMGPKISFELSFGTLPPQLKNLFISLGVFEGADFPLTAVAAVNQIKKDAARQNLDFLVNRSLVENSTEGRYFLHPLIKLFAREKIKEEKPFLAAVSFFSTLLKEVDYADRSSIATLESDLGNITYLFSWCFKNHHYEEFIKMWPNLQKMLFNFGYWDELKNLGLLTYKVAEHRGDLPLQASSATDIISRIQFWQGKFESSEKWARKGLNAARRTQNELLIDRANRRLVYLQFYKNDYDKAQSILKHTLEDFEKLNEHQRYLLRTCLL